MSTPLATVANSIIEFILSLLRDPTALEELKKNPDALLAKGNMAGVCAEDVRAVAPIIYDRPDIAPKPFVPAPLSDNDVVNEITRITSTLTMIDNRATIVDQSVNQNIWSGGGDVTQVFDQAAGVASGDGSMAAGDDTTTTGPPADDEVDDLDELPDPLEILPADVTDLPAEETLPVDDLPQDAPPVTEPTPTDVPLDAAVDAGVPAPAVDAIEGAPAAAAPEPAAVAYDPGTEEDETLWAEPAEAGIVEDVVYIDDLTEEQ